MTLSQLFLILLTISIMMLHRARASDVKNLTSISWSHGTNSQEKLREVLNSGINYIEADVVYGFLINDTTNQLPIMAHPPNTTSDISLEEFLSQIWEFNEKASKENQKGVKLDFKTDDVFKSSLEILNKMWTTDYEIWLNADIYSGPVESQAVPVNATFFFTEAKKFQNAVLSTGWTTRWGEDFTDESYTRDQINNMINGIRSNEVKNLITFPVRAGLAANSIEELKYLYNELKNSNSVTFTVWSSFITNDFVDIEGLRKMIFTFGVDKVYIDVPDVLYNQLQLDNNPFENDATSIKSSTAVLGILLLIAFIGHLFS